MSKEVAFEVGRMYGPLQKIAETLSAAQQDLFIKLPALAGYFPMSITVFGSNAGNHAGGNNLVQTGTVLAGYDGQSYREVGGGNNYLSDGSTQFDLTGTEAYIDPTIRGFTIGGWFNLQSTPTINAGLISKDGIVSNLSYAVAVNPALNPLFFVSGDGTTATFVTGSNSMGIGNWSFVCARYTPGVELAIILNGIKTVNTVSVPVSPNISTQAFEVGRYRNVNTRIVDARVRDIFVSKAILSDGLIEEIRQSSSPL